MLFNDREIALARLCQIAGRAADDKGRRPRSPGRETDLAQRTQSCARSPRRASRDLRGAGPRPAGANARHRGYLGALRDLRAKSMGPPRERASALRWGTDRVVLKAGTTDAKAGTTEGTNGCARVARDGAAPVRARTGSRDQGFSVRDRVGAVTRQDPPESSNRSMRRSCARGAICRPA